MALARKGSRPITVAGARLRYVVSRGQPVGDGRFALNLTVQSADGGGSVLSVRGMTTRDIWLDFPHIQGAAEYVTLEPAAVARLLERALREGWQPGADGPPFVLDVAGLT